MGQYETVTVPVGLRTQSGIAVLSTTLRNTKLECTPVTHLIREI
jgi:hypothetical protein